MVIPKKHRIRVADMTADEVADFLLVSRLIGSKLEKHFNCTSINYSIQDGPEAGQSIEHVHMHVLPRKKGDFEKSDEIYERLRNHDKNMTSGLRSLEQMAKEANEFRKLFNYE
jgi:bis(5'-adenosyl)-triphosphatase